MSAVSNDIRFLEVADTLRAGEVFLARVLLTKIPHDAFADEIASLVREGAVEIAIERIDAFLNPKFSSEAECLKHVGNEKHFHTSKQGSLL